MSLAVVTIAGTVNNWFVVFKRADTLQRHG